MNINEVINKSISIKDTMNGYLVMKVKNKRPYYNKSRNTYATERTVKLYICHCESCGEVDFRWDIKDKPKVILCRKKECMLGYYQKDIKPIEYNGKIYKIEDCPKNYYRNHRNPLEAWISHLKRMAEISKELQTPEHKEKMLKKHEVWSYAYFVKSNPDIEIDINIPWQCRQLEFYYSNPDNYSIWREYCKNELQKHIDKDPEHHRLMINANTAKNRKENPGKWIVRQLVWDIFRRVGQKKFAPTNKMGFDIEGIINELRKQAIELGFKGLRDIKATKLFHIDHIIPCDAFDLTIHSERLKCNHPSNLRWLPAKENISKSNKIRPEDIDPIKAIPSYLWPKGFNLKQYERKV